MHEQNPLYHGQLPASSSDSDPQSEENIPDHCRPLSPDRDGLDSSSEQLSPGGPEASSELDEDLAKENSAVPESSGVQPAPEQRYTSELNLERTGSS